jgi:hypothetical protein
VYSAEVGLAVSICRDRDRDRESSDILSYQQSSKLAGLSVSRA